MKQKLKDMQGAIVLESTYCFVIVVFMMFFLISYGFFLYQRTMVYVVAHEVAEEISQTYKLAGVTDASSVSQTDVTGVGMYRYTFHSTEFNNNNIRKAKMISDSRLMQSSLAKDAGGLKVEVKRIRDGLFRQHYEVTVSKRYSLLLGKMLSLINQEDVQQMETTVYVDSVDVLNYTNNVRLAKYGVNEIKDDISFVHIINNLIGVVYNLKQIFS